MIWRQKRYERPQREAAADCWLRAANLYSVHLAAIHLVIWRFFLPDQSVVLAMKAF